MRAALLVVGLSFGQAAVGCPPNFVDQLAADELTKLQKRELAKACKGRRFSISGSVENVDRDRNGVIEIRLKASNQQAKATFGEIWEVTLATELECGDATKIRKGQTLTLVSDFAEFGGFLNRHATSVNGTCKR